MTSLGLPAVKATRQCLLPELRGGVREEELRMQQVFGKYQRPLSWVTQL